MSISQTHNNLGVLVPLLRTIKNEEGGIPPAAVEKVAQSLGVDYAKVHKVASFYCRLDSLRRDLPLAS